MINDDFNLYLPRDLPSVDKSLLQPPGGKTKLSMLNHVMVSAEERVASANFHDPNHLQFKDTKRSDAQDLPADLFR